MNSTTVLFGYDVSFKTIERIFCETEYPETKWKPSAGCNVLEHKISFNGTNINAALRYFNERPYKVFFSHFSKDTGVKSA